MTTLPVGHRWLRLCKPDWDDPLDPSYAQRYGGRWNPPGSWPTLYLNQDPHTARENLRRLFIDQPVELDDLADDAPFELQPATLPSRQTVADLRDHTGLGRYGLPPTYPLDADGQEVGHDRTRPIGRRVNDEELRGIWCISAATADQSGRELAWFPARTAAASAAGGRMPFRAWRHADRTIDLPTSP